MYEISLYDLGNFSLHQELTKIKGLKKKRVSHGKEGVSRSPHEKIHGNQLPTVIIFPIAVVFVVTLLSKVIALAQAEQRCQACSPLDSPETHVLSLWLGSLAGVAPAEADILDLNEMVRQVTGKIPIFFYSHYGCYCRKGGQGQPRDATDR